MENNYPGGSGVPYGNGMMGANKKMMTPKEKKLANGLCILSLCLCYGPAVLAGLVVAGGMLMEDIGIFPALSGALEQSDSFITAFTIIIELLHSLCFIAAMVLMIVVRVKYPDSTFGKVLMWVYIAQVILAVIAVIVAVIACGVFIGSCVYGLQGCGEIGYIAAGIII